MKNFILVLTILTSETASFAQSSWTNDSLVNSLKQKFALTEYDKIDNVMQFNNDTALISGYLSDNVTYNTPKNVVYQTYDRGKNWKKIHFKGDAWIYDTHFEKDGKVWMGGSDEFVHYSVDYGTTWAKKPKPFNPTDRILTIYMTDSLNGIAGGLNNGLALTNDNWETTRQIPTPLDQNKFNILKNSARDRVEKVQIVDSFILINQNEHIYFSKLKSIEWQPFNIPTTDFATNRQDQTIKLYSIGSKVYLLDHKLNLIKTYITEEDDFFKQAVNAVNNDNIDIVSFTSIGIKTIKIKAVEYDLDKMSRGGRQFPLHKENIMEMKINEGENILTLLTTSNVYFKPLLQSFSFNQQDFDNYDDYYSQIKEKIKEEKAWGGDFTSQLSIENGYFMNPQKTMSNLNQSLLDTVYKTFSLYPFSFENDEPYIVLNIINNNSDTLKITSQNSNLFSLPWTVEYKGRSFQTYDTRITYFLRAILPKEYNYYDKLFAGELIYRLIEQRTINELEYKHSY
ncbi:MAG TPA: hypothetical protein VE978_12780 [Chitinophagales bacterium]|nr:hypothetical protein [Chitinophagales bacterium]